MISPPIPSVSVIIPVYQGEAYVAEALQSVLAQEGVDFEVIVGDNASKDRTVEVVRKHADSRVRIIENKTNLGIFGNLNQLVAAAQAPLVKILCADDQLQPGGLLKQVQHMQRRPSLLFSRCWGQDDEQDSSRWGRNGGMRDLPEVVDPSHAPFYFFIFGCFIGNLSNLIVRKEAVIAAGGFNQLLPYAGDFEMWVRLSAMGPFSVQDEVCVYVRRHDNQASALWSRRNEVLPQLDEIYRNLWEKIPGDMRLRFRLHASVVLLTQYWSRTLRFALQGDFGPLKILVRRREYTLGWTISLLVYPFCIRNEVLRCLFRRATIKYVSRKKVHDVA